MIPASTIPASAMSPPCRSVPSLGVGGIPASERGNDGNGWAAGVTAVAGGLSQAIQLPHQPLDFAEILLDIFELHRRLVEVDVHCLRVAEMES